MIVRHIRLENFRNHTRSTMELGGNVNILQGNNGQGKTNIIEAISCLCLTRSFFAASDTTLVQLGQGGFVVEGLLANDAGLGHRIRVAYSRETGEKVFDVDGVRLEKLSSVIGMFPVVVLAPEGNAITFGAPADRRRFMDLVLSQLSRTYFDDLLEYRQVLRQRNRILGEARQGKSLRDEILDPWNRNLAAYGARIMSRRKEFLREFAPYVAQAYADMATTREEPGMQYSSDPSIELDEDIGQIADRIHAELKEKGPEELRRGLSLVGPHRDDVVFHLHGLDLRKYASQGQHKTFLIALKIAEFRYLKEKREETPILLLDDVLSELDDDRAGRLLTRVADLGQTVVTTTQEAPFRDALRWGAENRRFFVEEGTCRPFTFNHVKETAPGI